MNRESKWTRTHHRTHHAKTTDSPSRRHEGTCNDLSESQLSSAEDPSGAARSRGRKGNPSDPFLDLARSRLCNRFPRCASQCCSSIMTGLWGFVVHTWQTIFRLARRTSEGLIAHRETMLMPLSRETTRALDGFILISNHCACNRG